MFDQIPEHIAKVITDNDLWVYSLAIRPHRRVLVLHIRAMFPYERYGWEPLNSEENKSLRVDVKKELHRLGYESKVRTVVYGGVKKINNFRLRILLKEEDSPQEEVQVLIDIRKQNKKNVEGYESRRKLASQM